MKDPRTNAFIEFCESQGIKFIDVESGRPIKEVINEDTGERLPTSEQDRTVDH